MTRGFLFLGLAAAMSLAWLWRPSGRPAPAAYLLLMLYAGLGGWAFWFGLCAPGALEPELLQLCKPTIVYWALAAVLVGGPLRGWDYPAKVLVGTYFTFSQREWRWINVALAAFLLSLGALNLYVAFTSTRDDWEGFKWSCMANVAAVLLLRVTFLWIDTAVRAARYLLRRVKGSAP
jgi:intracellular septation protein A